MSTKLRDLIRNVRACKTAAEERGLIQKEKALIRESFSSNSEAEYRPRNVAKLLFISMLGHDTDFGQMACLDLITANSYAEKRIGYLGLTQLFNEKSEVLMMATNRIRIDLNNQSNYIVSLALMALSEICTTEMCRDLSLEVLKLLQNGTAYIKKKAALAATRIVTRVPEKVDDFAAKVEVLLEDRHHGVLVASLQLCQHIIHISEAQRGRFLKFVSPMVRIIKSVYSTYSAEYDIGGVSDPFLQIEILRFFKIMLQNGAVVSNEVSEILTEIGNNTNVSKNTGNAVQYECVKTIFAIESTPALKTMGINILGKFLANKDANSRYVSLFMLQKVLKHDIQAVQKYKGTILECLRENDVSIKKLALDLLYMITTESNVRVIVKELLNILLGLAEDDEFRQDFTNKICSIIEKYAPTRRWYVDTFIKVLILSGNYVSEESTSSLIHLIIGTPELQSYAVHKLYFSLQENLKQEGLARTTAYCLGDFGALLIESKEIKITESDILKLLGQLLQQSDTIKEYALTALIKLYCKFTTDNLTIKKLILSLVTSSSLEVSKRAQEYHTLLSQQWDESRIGICEAIPVCPQFKSIYDQKPIGDVEIDELPPAKSATTTQSTGIPFDIDNIIKIDTNKPAQSTGTSPNDDPFNILKIYEQATQQQVQQPVIPVTQGPFDSLYPFDNQQQKPQHQPIQQQKEQPIQQQSSQLNLIDLGSLGHTDPIQHHQHYGQQPMAQLNPPPFIVQPQLQEIPQIPQIIQKSLRFIAFDDGALEIEFVAQKETPDTTIINVLFNNKTGSPITDLNFLAAVLKYLKLQIMAATSTVIPGNSKGQVTQILKIVNSQQGQKGIVIKLKIAYVLNGLSIQKEHTFNQFPIEY